MINKFSLEMTLTQVYTIFSEEYSIVKKINSDASCITRSK